MSKGSMAEQAGGSNTRAHTGASPSVIDQESMRCLKRLADELGICERFFGERTTKEILDNCSSVASSRRQSHTINGLECATYSVMTEKGVSLREYDDQEQEVDPSDLERSIDGNMETKIAADIVLKKETGGRTHVTLVFKEHPDEKSLEAAQDIINLRQGIEQGKWNQTYTCNCCGKMVHWSDIDVEGDRTTARGFSRQFRLLKEGVCCQEESGKEGRM